MTKKTYPADVQEAINAARDISSDENVNLQQAAEYLHGACPDAFPTPIDAAKVITGEDVREAEAAEVAERQRLADEAEALEKQRLADEAEALEKQRLADAASIAEAAPPTE